MGPTLPPQNRFSKLLEVFENIAFPIKEYFRLFSRISLFNIFKKNRQFLMSPFFHYAMFNASSRLNPHIAPFLIIKRKHNFESVGIFYDSVNQIHELESLK